MKGDCGSAFGADPDGACEHPWEEGGRAKREAILPPPVATLDAEILRDRLRWFVSLRWGMAILLLFAGIALWVFDSGTPGGPALAGLAAILTTTNVLWFGLLRRQRSPLLPLAWTQVLTDLLILTAVFYVSGGLHRPFVALYLLHVILAGFLLPARGTILVALVSAASVLALEFSPPIGKAAWAEIAGVRFGATMLILGGGAYLVSKLMEADRVASQQVQRERGRLATILENMTEGVVFLDPEGRVVLCNPAARLGPGCRACRGDRHFLECHDFPDRAEAEAQFQEFRRGRQRPFSLLHATGGREVSSAFVPVFGREGRLDSVVWSIVDITEQRNLERQVIHQEKMATLGQMAAGIAHEIGNPLSSISGVVQMLRRQKSAPAQELDLVYEQIERINRIVKEVMLFSRRGPEVRRVVHLTRILEDALRVASLDTRWRHLEQEVRLDSVGARVRGNSDRLLQVFLNILLNAADAMEGKGRIFVRCAVVGDVVRVTIGDTGPGIPEEFRRRVFEPFYTTKPPGRGTGLGLSVAWNIVTEHDGSIAVGERAGGGAEFRVDLPRVTGSEEEARYHGAANTG